MPQSQFRSRTPPGFVLLWTVGVTLLASGCGGGGGGNHTTPTPTLSSITVTPALPSISKGATQQFTATGIYSDGSTQNLMSSTTWNSSATAVATVSPGGLASGVAGGSTTIMATSGSVSGTTMLTVVAENSDLVIPRFQEFSDPEGRFANLNLAGPTDTTTNAFFQDLGTNGRRCVTCHQPSDAFSVTPPHIQERFIATKGTDPIFRPVDGANCPTVDVSTVEKRQEAYSLLLTRGLIRIGIAVPATADYEIKSVYNPYRCNATDVISMYRRPLPTTNLPFLSAVMFDGRESSPATGTTKILYDNYPAALLDDLAHQSVDATIGHAEGDGTRPTPEEQKQIVDFETKLFTAQIRDRHAGDLDEGGAKGGPNPLSTQPFFISIDSSVHFLLPAFEQPGGLVAPGDGQFNPSIFDLYGRWAHTHDNDNDRDRDNHEHTAARRSIARGEQLFNTLQIPITGVAGINDDVAAGGLVAGGIPSLQGTCGTCHDTPNVGNHSFPTPLNIGTGDPSPDNPSVNLGGAGYKLSAGDYGVQKGRNDGWADQRL